MTVRCPKCRRRTKLKACLNCGRRGLIVRGRDRSLAHMLKRVLRIAPAHPPMVLPHLECFWCGWIAYSIPCPKCQTTIALIAPPSRG